MLKLFTKEASVSKPLDPLLSPNRLVLLHTMWFDRGILDDVRRGSATKSRRWIPHRILGQALRLIKQSLILRDMVTNILRSERYL